MIDYRKLQQWALNKAGGDRAAAVDLIVNAGEGYAWDRRPERRALYVVMDFIDGSASAVPCGNSLEKFLATLHEGIPFRA